MDEIRFAQGPIGNTYWSSDKDKKLLSLQEQIKSHEQTITTLLKAKHEIEEENSKLKTKLEQSERNFLKKSKEADNLVGEKQTLDEKLNKQIRQETRNDQEDILEYICSLGKKIRKDFKTSGTIQFSVRELEKDIQSLIDDIVKEEKKQDETKGSVTKDKDKHIKDKTQKTAVKEETYDLLSLLKTMKHEKIKLNSDLVTVRKELYLICAKMYSTGKDLGMESDDEKLHDYKSSKETFTCFMEENRLSKVEDSRLTEGNPSITNLGDPNRPMKIAEMYSELYDNEWTDLMDKFEYGQKKPKGPKVLQALYSTLVGSYQLCITKSTSLEEKVKEIIQSTAKLFMIKELEEEVINQTKPFRKQHAEKAAAQLLKEFRLPKDQTVMKHLKVDKDMIKDILPTTFFEKCVTLCWMMIMQDPPMILQEGPKPGSTYDRNIFREFTSSGTKVEFTIWPALMLNEGGPLLVKGVVSVK